MNQKNNSVSVKVKRLNADALMPCQMTDGAVGYDLCTSEACAIYPQRSMDKAFMVGTGLAFAIPTGYHMKVFLRSSTGAKSKLRLANGTGIIDSDYRGEVKLLLENIGSSIYYLQKGERIAQCMIEKNIPTMFEEVEDLGSTKRGAKGIGSTGRKGSKANGK